MGYGYFNNGRLAFGNKLSTAFTSLDKLTQDMDVKINEIIESTASLVAYNDSYVVPVPTLADKPCNNSMVFDRLEGLTNISVTRDTYGVLAIKAAYYVSSTKSLVVIEFETDLEEGYVYGTYPLSEINSQNLDVEIISQSMYENRLDYIKDTNLLFKFQVKRKDDEVNDHVVIGKLNTDILITATDFDGYKSIRTTLINLPDGYYEVTDNDYECIISLGYDMNDEERESPVTSVVTINDDIVQYLDTFGATTLGVWYLARDDQMLMTSGRALKLEYLT